MNTIIGTTGDDFLNGTSEADRIEGGDGNDFLIGRESDDILLGGSGNDNHYGGDGDDYLEGNGGDDYLRGEGGDDVLIGGDGSDILRGSSGVDHYDGGAEDPDSTTFGLGSFGDRVSFYEPGALFGVIADLRTGMIWNDGFGNVETMIGIESLGGDTVWSDQFYGNDARNLLLASVGDFIYGFGGDDAIQVSGAAAVVDGGDGVDTLTLSSVGYLVPDTNGDGIAEIGGDMTDGWYVDLGANALRDGFGNWGSVHNFELVVGTGLGDTLIGGAGDDVLHGAGGDDWLRGWDGNDHIDGGDGFDVASFNLPEGTPGSYRLVEGTGTNAGIQFVERVDGDTVERVFMISKSGAVTTVTGLNSMASRGTDSLVNIEEIHILPQGPFDEGRFLNVQLTARQYGDWIQGSDVAETLEIGAFDGATSGTGGSGDDVLIGTEEANRLFGWTGSDTLLGAGGDDFLQGDPGDDFLDGGDGVDLAGFHIEEVVSGRLRLVEGSGDLAGRFVLERVDGDMVEQLFVITLDGGTVTVEGRNSAAGYGTDTLVDMEEIHLHSGPNYNPDLFVSVLLQPRQYDAGFIAGSIRDDTLTIAPDSTVLYVDGRWGNDIIIGNDANNVLTGDRGDDLLLGGGGDDYLNGGDGNDTLDGGLGAVDIGSFQLPEGTPGDLRLVDGTGDDAGKLIVERIDGDVVEAVFRITVTEMGSAIVEGLNSAAHLGTDTVTNMSELHIFVTNRGPDDPFVWVNLTPKDRGGWIDGSEAPDTIDLGDYPSAASAWGGRGNDIIVGNALNNTLTGDQGDDQLHGMAGNDTLRGFEGHDLLEGGNGNDFLVGDGADSFGDDVLNGGSGNDRVSYFNNVAGVQVSLLLQGAAQDTGVTGSDTLIGIEHITGSNFSDMLIGDEGANWLWSLNGDDVLAGNGGDDLFTLGFGNHTIDGGAGTDTVAFWTGNSGNLVVSLAVQGSAQATEIGSLTLTGIENLSGTFGSETFLGDEEANILAGSGGADWLAGGGGNDLLLGDGIIDIGPDISATLYLGHPNIPAGPDHLEGGEGADTLIGGGGDDQLLGGAGDDFIVGGLGNDTIDGGGGEGDYAVFYLPEGMEGTFQTVAGTGAEAGKLLVQRVSGDQVETVAVIGAADGVITVQGVNSGSFLGTDTIAGVGRLLFSVLTPDPLGQPYDPEQYIVVETAPLLAADTTPPDAPVIDPLVTGDATPLVTGTAEPDALVSLYDGAGALLGSGQAGADGAWAIEVESPLLDGVHTLSAIATDAAGNASQAGFGTISLEIAGETIIGGNGGQTIVGTDGRDTISGGNGVDLLDGGHAPDRLDGGNGDDELLGGGGGDLLFGGNGADRLFGGEGDDALAGGRGDDLLSGGAGADLFLFEARGGSDTVLDFEVGTDRILLAGTELKDMQIRDVNGDGVLDVLLQFSNGSATLLGAGSNDLLPADLFFPA